MNIPKVEFCVAPLNKIFPMIHSFLNPSKGDWNWSGRILRYYPQLENKLKCVQDKDKRKEIEYNFFKEIFKKERIELEKRVKIFQGEWDKINDKIMLVLSKVVEQEWPKEDKKIFARVSLNPICPRYIKERIFDVFYKDGPKYMKNIAIHEILHFIYFEKWKQVFPKTKEKEFNSPYLAWHLSEMVPGIILNDKRVQNIFKDKFKSYREYNNFRLKGKPLLSYFQDFYDSKKDFADFLKKSWKSVKEYEKKGFGK